jgi:hypothetical protein
MTRAVVVRWSWSVLALPLAFMVFMVSLAMWPLVVQNSAPRLALIAYVAACPLLPVLLRSRRVTYVLLAAVAALAAQILAFGVINFWF